MVGEQLPAVRYQALRQQAFQDLFRSESLSLLADPQTARAVDVYTLDPRVLTAVRQRILAAFSR
jgi:hypothetical protein